MKPNKMKVMIADDEETIIEGLKKLVPWEEKGFSVVCDATDGISAVNSARKYRPDIIVMDINMPLLSGLEVIKRLRDELKNTVFIILSGYNEFEYAREAIHLHVSEYLLKPVKLGEFSNTLDTVRLKLLKEQSTQDQEEVSETETPVIHKIVAYINDHLSEPICLRQLADEFNLNPSYVSQLFKNKTGMNYYSYLNQKRICRAKKLLLTSSLSITQVSMAVGFSDYRVFTKAFKQQENMPPSRYRFQNTHSCINVVNC